MLAWKGFQVFNYVDDIFAWCHDDHTGLAFHTLKEIINRMGLPANPNKVLPPATNLSIMAGLKLAP